MRVLQAAMVKALKGGVGKRRENAYESRAHARAEISKNQRQGRVTEAAERCKGPQLRRREPLTHSAADSRKMQTKTIDCRAGARSTGITDGVCGL